MAASDSSAAQGQLGPDFHQRDEDNIDASREQPAAQTWLVQVFSFHADYIARDGGVRLPSGWEPLRIEATGGNKYRVYARKQEVAT